MSSTASRWVVTRERVRAGKPPFLVGIVRDVGSGLYEVLLPSGKTALYQLRCLYPTIEAAYTTIKEIRTKEIQYENDKFHKLRQKLLASEKLAKALVEEKKTNKFIP